MGSTSETGHAKNVSNFKLLITEAQGMGADYQPVNALLSTAALDTLHTESNNAQKAVNSNDAASKSPINNRQMLYDALNPTVTRALNSLDVSGASDALVQDARGIAKRISGHSGISQLSYDMRLDNFDSFIQLLKNESAYAPNETEIQTATLETMYSDMVAANNAVIAANKALSDARGIRNRKLYGENGLVDVAMDVKKYVRSVYGSNDPRFKRVSGIEFKRIEEE